MFIKFVCQNERIGSLGGVRAGCAPPKSANGLYNTSNSCSSLFHKGLHHPAEDEIAQFHYEERDRTTRSRLCQWNMYICEDIICNFFP